MVAGPLRTPKRGFRGQKRQKGIKNRTKFVRFFLVVYCPEHSDGATAVFTAGNRVRTTVKKEKQVKQPALVVTPPR
jgi:hypothetical protein